jgi:hypothetical protein
MMKSVSSRYTRTQMIRIIAPVLLILSIGCSKNIQTPRSGTASVLSSDITIPPPTQTQTISTQTPTITSKPILKTVTPTKKATQALEPENPEPILLPTFTDLQAEEFILDSQSRNAGCDLPCWWGIIPGVTDLDKAIEKIAILGLNFYFRKGVFWVDNNPDRKIISTGLSITKYSFGTTSYFFSENGQIEVIKVVAETSPGIWELIYGDPFYLEAMKRFYPDNLLSSYGKPDQVLLYVLDASDPNAPDYFLHLYYPKKGILIEYYGQSKEQKDGLQICPNTAMVSLWLGSPEKDLSILELRSHAIMTNEDDERSFLSNFLPIEDAAGMDVAEFYETFKAGDACLQTPPELWGR